MYLTKFPPPPSSATQEARPLTHGPLEITHNLFQSTDTLSYSWICSRDTLSVTSSDIWPLSWRLHFGGSTYCTTLYTGYLEVPQNFLVHALTILGLKHIGQLPVSLICTAAIVHWEAVSPSLSVHIFPACVTTLLSKLIYSSTKVIIFLNWYKYWIKRINQMYSRGNLS